MRKEGKRKELFSFNLPLKNRKGLSAIVATLIIILLVLVAAGIIWVVVRNIMSEGAEGIELGRFTLDLSIKSAYIDGTNVKVIVRRSPGGGDLIGVRFIFFNSTDSISVDRRIPLIELQERLFSFNSSEVDDINALQEVSVAPIYESSSGRETVGDITDTATISSSLPPGDNGNGVNGNGDNGNGDNGNGDNGEPPAPVSCNGTWDGTAEDSGVECDGTPLPNGCSVSCLCQTGFTPDTLGGCDLDSPINQGDIFLVWPEDGNAHRFKSPDLPKNQSELQQYTSYYVNFSSSPETRCFRIQTASYFEDVDISEIGLLINFLFDPLANVSQGQQYDIWEAEYCGA
jgi:flagellin-like protein